MSGVIDSELYTALQGSNKINLNGIKAKNINTSGSVNLPWEVKLLLKTKLSLTLS